MSKIYGYCRCSTNERKQDIQRQVRELMQQGATKETIYMEYESGSKTDRIELKKLFAVVTSGDTILTTEVSRITRSTKQLCEIIQFAKEKQLKLIIDTFIIDCSKGMLDPMTEGMLKMMGVFSEMEKNMIILRVKSGLANARAKGKKIGRPCTTKNEIPDIYIKYLPQYINNTINVVEFSKLCQMSRTTIYKYLNLMKDDESIQN